MRAFFLLPSILCAALLTSGSLPRLDAEASFGTRAFVAAPTSIALQMPVQAGGDVAASELGLGSDCRGFIQGAAPSVRIDFQQADAFDLWLSVVADARHSLVVNSSDGQWYCAQSSTDHRSYIRLAHPNSGQIDIWVGAFSERFVPAVVTIGTQDPRSR